MIRDTLREPDKTDETDWTDGVDEGLASGAGFVILIMSVFANEAMIFPCRYQIASPTSQISSASITRPSFKCSSSARAVAKPGKRITQKHSHRDTETQSELAVGRSVFILPQLFSVAL